jgi:hypothetical protein
VGALSDGKVVETLNRSFIPVYAVNEDYENGVVPADEQKQRQRIWGEASQKKLPWGMVCSYFLDPKDGHLIETGPVAKYSTAEALLPLLERIARDLKTEPGKTVVPPAAQSAPPKRDPDGLALHLTSRYVDSEGHPEPAKGRHTYHEIPAEDWVILGRAEREKLAPPAGVNVGAAWDVDPEVARKVLRWFYPPIEDNANISVEEQAWKARVLSVEAGTLRVRFDGSATVKHLNFYDRKRFSLAQTTFAGYMDFDLGEKRVKTLELATEQGHYGDALSFGIAVRLVP